jgi:phage host-nuclease inhibitor protein Gam
MLELAQLHRDAERIRLDTEENIDQIKENARAEMEPILARKKTLEDAICTFATLNKGELFRQRKSLDTPYGPYGFRKSTKLQTMPKVKLQDVLDRLQELNITEAIKVKRSVDKESMREWPEPRLETVGMRRVSKDEFFIEVTDSGLGDA